MKTLLQLLTLYNSAKSSLADLMESYVNGENGISQPLDPRTEERIEVAYLIRKNLEYLFGQENPDLTLIFQRLNLMISYIGDISSANQIYNSYTRGSGMIFPPGVANLQYASNTVYGITRLTVAPLVTNQPIAIGANDPRVAEWTTAYNRSLTNISINSAGQIVVDRQDGLQVTSAQSVIVNQIDIIQSASFRIDGIGIADGFTAISTLNLATRDNLGAPATQFSVFDSDGNLRFREPAEVLSDIGGAPASGSGNYIQNQNASAQTANAWIDGTLRADTAFRLGTNYSLQPETISFTNYAGGAATNVSASVLNAYTSARYWAWRSGVSIIGLLDFSDTTRMVFQNFNGGIGLAPAVGNEVVAQRRFRIGTYGLTNNGIFITPQKSYNGSNVQAIEQIQNQKLALISTVEDGNVIPHLVASDTTSAVANYSATNTYWRLERNNNPFLDVTYDGRIRPYNIPTLGSAATTFLTVSGNFIQSRTAFQTLQDTGAFRYLAGISTGLQNGGLLSIDTDPTKFDLSAGYGIVVDDTDPLNPIATAVTWSAFNAQTVTNLGTQPVTYIGINSSGAIVQQSTLFTNAQRRSIIQIGVVVHSNLTTINAVNNFPAVINETTSQLHDLMTGLGIFNVNGNIYSANGANLNINKSSGAIFKLGSNFEIDPNNPNERATTSLTALTFRYRLRNSTEYPDTTSIDPNNYDNAGVLTAVPVNRWTIQRIYLSQTNATRIQYGQNLYNTFAEASAAINSESFVTEQNIAENLLLRGFLIVKQGTTALNNTADAQFFSAAKFGANAIGAGTSTTTLQQAYLNSTIPQITTTTALGAVTMRRGSAADTDNVLVVQNGAGSNVMSVTGAGVMTLATALGRASGGTGLSTAPTNGQLLIGNGTGYTLATLTGTANQVTVTNGAGTITLSLPQAINTTATPRFAKIGLGTASATNINLVSASTITGATSSFAFFQQGAVQSDVTTTAVGYANQVNTQATAFTLTTYRGYLATQATLGAGSSITNLEGYTVDATYIGGTNNYGFRGLIPSGANRWNAYMDGTAANAFVGQTIFGSTTLVTSALVALSSTTQGFRPPVMTTAQKNAIASPTAGLMVYDSTLSALALYTSAWQALISGSGTTGFIPLFTAAGAIGNSIMSESAGVVTTTGAQSINTTFGTSLSLLMTDNDTNGTKNITQVIRNRTNYLVGYDFSAYTEYSFQTQWTGSIPNTYTSAVIRSGFDIDGGTGGAPYGGTLRFHTFWGDTNGGGALTEHLLLYGDAINPYAKLYGALQLDTAPATATAAGAYDLLVRDAAASGTIKQISSNATGFIKLRRASINALVTGTYVLSNLQDNFIPIGYSVVVNNSDSVSGAATISIGTNSPNYEDVVILPAMGVSNASGTNGVYTAFLGGLTKFKLMSTDDLRVNVSVAATGTTYNIDIILFGYIVT